jgi:hypothetical protein
VQITRLRELVERASRNAGVLRPMFDEMSRDLAEWTEIAKKAPDPEPPVVEVVDVPAPAPASSPPALSRFSSMMDLVRNVRCAAANCQNFRTAGSSFCTSHRPAPKGKTEVKRG